MRAAPYSDLCVSSQRPRGYEKPKRVFTAATVTWPGMMRVAEIGVPRGDATWAEADVSPRCLAVSVGLGVVLVLFGGIWHSLVSMQPTKPNSASPFAV